MEMKKKLGIIVTTLIAIGGITAYVVTAQQPKKENKSEIKQSVDKKVEKNDPYENIDKDKVDKVKSAEKAIDELLKATNETRDEKITQANKAIEAISSDIAEIKTVYHDILTVIKDPTIENLQTARTHIKNLSDSKLSVHLKNKYEHQLIELVAKKINKSEEDVEKDTIPLTPQEEKEKAEAKVKADKEAKEKAEREAKAKAEQESNKKVVEEQANQNQSLQQEQANQVQGNQSQANETQNQGSGQVQNGGSNNYTPPANNGSSNPNNQTVQNNGNTGIETYDPNRPLPTPSEENGWGTVGEDLGEWGGWQ